MAGQLTHTRNDINGKLGPRSTEQRQLILEIIHQAEGHLDADEIYQQAPYPVSPGFGGGQGFYPAYVASPAFGNAPFAPQVTPEQELDLLNNQAEVIKGQLEQIETKMRDLESEK